MGRTKKEGIELDYVIIIVVTKYTSNILFQTQFQCIWWRKKWCL